MQLILAIDSDPRRSEQLANLVRARLGVDLVQATSAGEGLHALRERIPDLILTSPLLSPFDDGVLDEYLRDLGASAGHVQTVRIPMLSTGPKKKSAAGRLFALGRKTKNTSSSAAPDGCDPKIFADEIAHYLTCSAEQRAASGKAPANKTPEIETASVAPPVDQWGPADAVVEEFRGTMQEEREPIAAPYAIEETQVPGSILDLRPRIHAPEPQVVVEPEPLAFIEPEPQPVIEPEPPTFFEPEPLIEPEPPTFFEQEPLIEPEPPAFFEPEPPVYVEPVMQAIVEPPAYVAPEPPRPGAVIVEAQAPKIGEAATSREPKPATAAPTTSTGTSPSFEAALAAIRAAWVKPEDKKTEPKPPTDGAVHGRPKVLGAGSGEVDLTRAIDALEDVVGSDGQTPGAGEEPSLDDSKTPAPRQRNEKANKRPEKSRGRKMRGPDGRDEWGVFDPKQCGFSALVDKLDEVTEDEGTGRADANAR